MEECPAIQKIMGRFNIHQDYS